jgi:hypothetical protein
MADSRVCTRSVNDIAYNSNSQTPGNENLNKIKLDEMLGKYGNDFVWNGSIGQLKRFVS